MASHFVPQRGSIQANKPKFYSLLSASVCTQSLGSHSRGKAATSLAALCSCKQQCWEALKSQPLLLPSRLGTREAIPLSPYSPRPYTYTHCWPHTSGFPTKRFLDITLEWNLLRVEERPSQVQEGGRATSQENSNGQDS